jgi:hypothetical protein
MDDTLEHPYINEDREVISLLRTIEREHPVLWVGKDKALLQIVKDEPDRYMWERRRGSVQLGIPESELATEPDEMPDHSDDQGYDHES